MACKREGRRGVPTEQTAQTTRLPVMRRLVSRRFESSPFPYAHLKLDMSTHRFSARFSFFARLWRQCCGNQIELLHSNVIHSCNLQGRQHSLAMTPCMQSGKSPRKCSFCYSVCINADLPNGIAINVNCFRTRVAASCNRLTKSYNSTLSLMWPHWLQCVTNHD